MKKHLPGFLGGLFLGVLVAFLLRTPLNLTNTSLKITGPDGEGSLTLEMTGSGIDYKEVLEKLFSDTSFLKPAAIGWLEQQQKIYPIDSMNLVNAVATQLCEPIPEQSLWELRIQKERECEEKPVVKQLRELARTKAMPFHYVGKVGAMGVPEDPQNQPKEQNANVCLNGEYYAKKLQVGNTHNDEVIEVQAFGSYVCTPAYRFPDIQLNPIDAKKLFKNIPLQKLQEVVIVPIE
jgi:hypothetical protein